MPRGSALRRSGVIRYARSIIPTLRNGSDCDIITDIMTSTERSDKLMTLIPQLRKQLREYESELRDLLLDVAPKAPRKRRAKADAGVATKPRNGNERGDLTKSIRAAVKKMHGEFTSNELMEAAGIPEEQKPSAFSAISRLAARDGEGFKKSETKGKYRRV